MKIKVIDILNTIARGEEPPKKIMYKGKEYYYHKGYDFDYCYTTNKGGYLPENTSLFQFDLNKDFNDNSMIEFLNDEVEILEITITNKPDKIEKINTEIYSMVGIINKINEIIDYIQE